MKMADTQIKRRNIPGTKASVSVPRIRWRPPIAHFPLPIILQDFCNWPDEAFEEMDTLAVQQYIQQLIKHDPSEIDTILRMPDGQDEGVWKYEHLRWV